jgi:copper chaperone CopZ
MTCAHCISAVSGELTRIDGVTGVDVDLPTGNVTVTSAGSLDPTAVQHAVEEAGYELAS